MTSLNLAFSAFSKTYCGQFQCRQINLHLQVIVRHLSNFVTNRISADLEKRTLFISLTVPMVAIRGNYRVDGNVFVFQISGNGPFQVSSNLFISKRCLRPCTLDLRIVKVWAKNRNYGKALFRPGRGLKKAYNRHNKDLLMEGLQKA